MSAAINLPDIRRQERAILQGLLVDLAVFIPMLIVAVLSRSLLLLSDGIEFFRSFAVNGTSLHILRRIRKGQTAHYDYGAGKMECLGSLIGASLFIVGLLILASFAIRRFIHGGDLHAGFTFVGMLMQLGGLLVNSFFWWRNKRIAKDTGAPLIDMQWRHNRTDTLACAAVFTALALMIFLRHKPWVGYIDPACTLLYAIYAIGLYLPVVRNALRDLLDQTLEEDLQIRILRRLAEHFDRYDSFHGVRSRRIGGRAFIEITLGFKAERRVGEAIDIIHALRRALQADIPNSEVSVGIEQPELPAISSIEKTSYQFFPLSETTLEPALELLGSTFEILPDELPREELEEAIWPGKHTQILAEKTGVSQPRYWVVFNEGRVVGLCGLVLHPDDLEAVWGGWSVYHDERRTGLSRARLLMLRKLAAEACRIGRPYFRLDTTTEDVSLHANRLYDRVGLKVYKTEQIGNVTRLYRDECRII